MLNPLIQRALGRTGRSLRRPLACVAIVLAALGLLAIALSVEVANRDGVTRAYTLLAWTEFVLVSTLALVEGGTSIADERQRKTWDAMCLTGLSGSEIARGKFLGSLLSAATLALLAAPAHVALAARGGVSWEMVAGVHGVLIGTACAVAGVGVMASAWTDKGLQGVALAASSVLFLWFGTLDWLASRGLFPWLCPVIQPLRQLERLLGDALLKPRYAAAGRGMGYLVFVGLVTIGTLMIAARGARRPVHRAAIFRWVRRERRRVRPVWDDSLRWRETFEPGGRRIVALVALAALIPIIALTTHAWDPKATGITHGLSAAVNGYLLILMIAAGVVVGMRASMTLVDEKVRGTLDLLRLAGVEPAEMIRSKLAAILASALWLMPIIAAVAVLGFSERQGDALTPRAWFGAAGIVAVSLAFAVFVASISLLISVYARSTPVALVSEIILLLGILLGTMLFAMVASPFLPGSVSIALAAASPVYQVSIVGAHASRSPTSVGVPALLGILCAEFALALAALAWSCHSLERRRRPVLQHNPLSNAVISNHKYPITDPGVVKT